MPCGVLLPSMFVAPAAPVSNVELLPVLGSPVGRFSQQHAQIDRKFYGIEAMENPVSQMRSGGKAKAQSGLERLAQVLVED